MLDSLLRGSLSSRLTRLVGFPATIFLILIIAVIAARSFRRTVEEKQEAALNTARTQAVRLDSAMAEAAIIPEMHARILESGSLQGEDRLQSYLTEVVNKSHEFIYGSCLSFEPNTYALEKSHYAPYAWWKDGRTNFSVLAPPDYDHFTWDWYKLPKQLNRAIWTEPYFDEGGGDVLMTTRSVPFYKSAAGGGKTFWGVATIDISLDQLIRNLREVKVADTGYALLISPEGRFLVHPDPTKIMKGTLRDDSRTLADGILTGGEGFLRTTEPVRQTKAWIAYAPVPHGGFTLALVYPASEIMRPAYQLLWDLAGLAAIGVIALFSVLVMIARSVSFPVVRLAAAARKVADGDLDQRLDEQVNISEVRDLTLAFVKMTKDLRMRMEELKYTTTLKERMAGELNAARRIQMSMLPRELASRSGWPEHADVSLHAVIQPAREVGGDFYDYRFLDERRLSILIGDVSGKGVPAALFMAMTQTLFKGHATPDRTPIDTMAKVNDALCAETQTGMFVTLIYAVLDTETGVLELCNAGHPPPCLLTPQGMVRSLQGSRNPALGLMKGMTFTSSTFQLQASEKIIFYTDGVTEAFNQAQELYTLSRFESVLSKNASMSVQEISEAIMIDVRAHSGNQEPSDDLTMVAVKMADSKREPLSS
jgi:phosphoserine phosphatase RsbU/P